MENASKALVIAGSITIAVITISLFTLMFRSIGVYMGETSKKEGQAELTDFNKGFDSYNKKLMYGSEVITVINKAIDSNTREKAVYGDEYYINIGFKLKNELEHITEKYTRVSASNYQLNQTSKIITPFNEKTRYYEFRNDLDYKKINDYIINAMGGVGTDSLGNEVNFDNKGQTSEPIYSNDRSSYTIIRYPASEFKRRPFKCTSVKYDEHTRKNKRNAV